MEQKQTSKRLITILTGFLFAAYSAYYIFIIIKNGSSLTSEYYFISVVVALMFALLAAFVWTCGVKDIRFLVVRRITLIITLAVIIFLKLRLANRVIDYIDVSQPHTVLYAASYFMMVAGLLILFVYYVFIRKRTPFFPRASVLLPVAAIVLFLLSLAAEAILFFGYGIGLEPSVLRTVVIRPVFYLGFVGMSAYFLYPPRVFAPVERV